MKTVHVVETAVVSALGNTLEELWQGLLDGRSAIKPVRRFPVSNYITQLAACIEELDDSHEERSIIHALIDLLISRLQPVPPNTRLFTATTKAGIDNLEKIERNHKSDIADILLTSVSSAISQKLGLRDTGLNISSACASSTIAIARGAALIASGKAESVLICCLDTINEFVFSGFSSLKALSPVASQPFDINREGLSLGEGAAAVLLMSEDALNRGNRPSLGTIAGWGAANDATHITAPARDGSGLIRAIQTAVDMAGISNNDIAAVSAHGTGTIYNDMMELTAFGKLFGSRRLPVNSIKGAIGHTLGAAGGIEVALGLKMLQQQVVPPTVGFTLPEEGAEGRVDSLAQNMTGSFLLSTNSGFGGINAAIILKKGGMV